MRRPLSDKRDRKSRKSANKDCFFNKWGSSLLKMPMVIWYHKPIKYHKKYGKPVPFFVQKRQEIPETARKKKQRRIYHGNILSCN